MAVVEASWDQVDVELEHVDDALARMELTIPERIPGSPQFGVATRICGFIEGAHALVELAKQWAKEARKVG